MAFRHTKENCIYCKKRTAFFRKNGFCGCRLKELKIRFIQVKRLDPEEFKSKFMYFARLSYTSKVAAIKRNERIENGTYKEKNRKPRSKTELSKSVVKSDMFYLTWDWRKLRAKVLNNKGFKCCWCNRNPRDHGVVLHVDHIKPKSKYPELALEESNLQVLCEDCNVGKSNIEYEPQLTK